MIDPGDVVAVVLAAGLSRRFGPADKLTAPYRGEPLVAHAARLTQQFPFKARLAVVRPESAASALLAEQGLELCENPEPARGMGSSLAIAAGAAESLGAAACLILLGDMPNVTPAHLRRLFDTFGAPAYLVASTDGQHRSPPSLFGRQHFAALRKLAADTGGSSLIASAPTVLADARMLADVDVAADLQPD